MLPLAACNIGSPGGDFTPSNDNVLTVMTQPLPTTGFWEGTSRHPTGGFEYELAEELADRLGLDGTRIETEDFTRIVSGELGDADIAMSLITPTDEREKVLDFSTPYMQSPPVLLAREGAEIPDVDTAQEMKLAVGSNTTFEEILDEDIRPDSPALRFEDRNSEIRAVLEGQADAALFDLPAAQAIANRNDRLTVAARLGESEPIAVALPLDSSNTTAVGSALRAMEADGTIDRIAGKWLGKSLTDLSGGFPLLRTGP